MYIQTEPILRLLLQLQRKRCNSLDRKALQV
jgi:hypothetical protein